MAQKMRLPTWNKPHILYCYEFFQKYIGLPSLDTLFLVFPFSWKGMLVQYTGRLNRISHEKKEIHVYDYVDEKVPVLSRMYGRRLKGYKVLGFTVVKEE